MPKGTLQTKTKAIQERGPRLLTPKKKGDGYVCLDECPQYKSAKLCSYTLANGSLNSFISSFARVKRAPNLTNLATTGMPKGRGCKGIMAPSKRRPLTICLCMSVPRATKYLSLAS